MARSVKLPLLAGAFFVLFGMAPVISVFIADTVAAAHACRLHEGVANPCIISGVDRSELLYSMVVMGWLALVTIPVGAVGLLTSLGFALRAILLNARNRPRMSTE